MTRIERKIWNAERGGFTGTGEAIEVDIDALEPATERVRVTGDRFLKGPFPGLGLPAPQPCRVKRCWSAFASGGSPARRRATRCFSATQISSRSALTAQRSHVRSVPSNRQA